MNVLKRTSEFHALFLLQKFECYIRDGEPCSHLLYNFSAPRIKAGVQFFLSLLPFLNIGTFKSRSSNVRGGGMVSRPFEKARVKKRKKEKGEKTKGKKNSCWGQKGEIRSKKARLFV